jgi:hypothetical protein
VAAVAKSGIDSNIAWLGCKYFDYFRHQDRSMRSSGRISPGEDLLYVLRISVWIVFLVFFGERPGVVSAIPLTAHMAFFFRFQSLSMSEIVVIIRIFVDLSPADDPSTTNLLDKNRQNYDVYRIG